MPDWNIDLDIGLGPSETGKTILVTLANIDDVTDNRLEPHATASYVDMTGIIEYPPTKDSAGTALEQKYGGSFAIPEGFGSDGKGRAVFHLTAVGAGADFTGVTVLGVVNVTPNDQSMVDGKTPTEYRRYSGAVLAGQVSGAGSGTETFKGLDGSTDRVQSTVDSSGNRTAISYDP